MSTVTKEKALPPDLPVSLERDIFLRSLLRELAGILEDVVGIEEASGFIGVVGQRIGEWIGDAYRQALDTPRLTREQVAHALVDLKRRIQGGFRIVEVAQDRIVLANRACPFAEKVKDRPSLCMMTSSVFGVIAAENLGYAKVSIEEAIARGDAGCRIVIYLRPTEESRAADGREYFESSRD